MEERLQKIIADAGVTSRRKAEVLIVQGRVTVNGQRVTELGSKADAHTDHIRVDGKPLVRAAHRIYVLLNKPIGIVSTVSDPAGRPTVISLVRGVKERIYPVGRLDYHSSGLMLLTNDGELANYLMSRASGVARTYHVKLESHPTLEQVKQLESGIVLDGRRTAPCRVRRLNATETPAQRTEKSKFAAQKNPLGERSKPWYEITLVEGRYHQVRRMFERIGHGVIKLKRVKIAFLGDRGLAPGEFRHLTVAEVERLKRRTSEEPR